MLGFEIPKTIKKVGKAVQVKVDTMIEIEEKTREVRVQIAEEKLFAELDKVKMRNVERYLETEKEFETGDVERATKALLTNRGI